MKKITLLTLCACCIFTAFSEHVPKAYKKYFVNCCDARKTNIREQLDIDGYFTEKYLADTTVCNWNILFYDNGLCVESWAVGDAKAEKELAETFQKGSKSGFYQDAAWGTYELRGDTIITRTIIRVSIVRPVPDFIEAYYKIKDRKTLVDLGPNPNPGVIHPSSEFNFTGYFNLPNPDYSWIKKQKCKLCDSLGSPIQTRHK